MLTSHISDERISSMSRASLVSILFLFPEVLGYRGQRSETLRHFTLSVPDLKYLLSLLQEVSKGLVFFALLRY